MFKLSNVARLLLSCLFALSAMPSHAQQSSTASLKIGIIGTGHVGSALARLWVAAGHEVLMSSRHPDELKPLAAELGPRARVGTPQQAARFGDVVLISVPYGALPQIGKDLAVDLAGKVVLDTGNPYPGRDGPMAEEARAAGTGVSSQRYLPGTRLVRAFNAIAAGNLLSQSRRPSSLVAIPIAGDDEQALRMASGLVRDAGFEPVVVGPLTSAKRFDVGSSVYVRLLNAAELRQELGLEP